MSICFNIKQKFNEARMKGERSLTLNKKDTTEQQLQELRDCGYNIRERRGKIIVSE